ncbi:MAG: hypothetical protein Q6L68_12720 [Thermostichus sp. DG02_5_bins_236]
MAEHPHRDWSISTQATDQGFIFRCQKQETTTKAYGYFQSEAEAILAGMIWIDQQHLPDHMDGILYDNEEPER